MFLVLQNLGCLNDRLLLLSYTERRRSQGSERKVTVEAPVLLGAMHAPFIVLKLLVQVGYVLGPLGGFSPN